jgi:hypothetical protein
VYTSFGRCSLTGKDFKAVAEGRDSLKKRPALYTSLAKGFLPRRRTRGSLLHVLIEFALWRKYEHCFSPNNDCRYGAAGK